MKTSALLLITTCLLLAPSCKKKTAKHLTGTWTWTKNIWYDADDNVASEENFETCGTSSTTIESRWIYSETERTEANYNCATGETSTGTPIPFEIKGDTIILTAMYLGYPTYAYHLVRKINADEMHLEWVKYIDIEGEVFLDMDGDEELSCVEVFEKV